MKKALQVLILSLIFWGILWIPHYMNEAPFLHYKSFLSYILVLVWLGIWGVLSWMAYSDSTFDIRDIFD